MASDIRVVRFVDGAESVTERVVSSTEFIVEIDGQLYQPELTSEIEMENDASTSSPSDQCGNTERSRQTNEGWKITVNGVVSDYTGDIATTDNLKNLSLELLRDEIARRDTITVYSDIINGDYELSNVVITQTSDLVEISTDTSSRTNKAFEFQMQLGESES